MWAIPALFALPCVGQEDTAVDSATDPGSVVTEPAESNAAPATFESLYEEFATLVPTVEINFQGFLVGAARPQVRDLVSRVSAFNDEQTPTPRSVAVEIQLSLWLNDQDRLRAVSERLDVMQPEDPGLRIFWADQLRVREAFAQAFDVLDETAPDLARYPVAAVVRAECLLAENRFAEAAEALRSIPKSARMSNQELDRYWRLKEELSRLSADWAIEQSIREQEARSDDLPRVAFQTSRGTIVVELFENEAPNTVANFISLVESGFYDSQLIVGVVDGLRCRIGDPSTRVGPFEATGSGPGYTIDNEQDEATRRRHFTGSLSMIRAGLNTHGSQFDLYVRPVPDMNGRQTVFGRVLEGIDVARTLENDDLIESVTVIRKRPHEYVPLTNPDPTDPAAEGPSEEEGDASEAGGEAEGDEGGEDTGEADDAGGDETGEDDDGSADEDVEDDSDGE